MGNIHNASNSEDVDGLKSTLIQPILPFKFSGLKIKTRLIKWPRIEFYTKLLNLDLDA